MVRVYINELYPKYSRENSINGINVVSNTHSDPTVVGIQMCILVTLSRLLPSYKSDYNTVSFFYLELRND